MRNAHRVRDTTSIAALAQPLILRFATKPLSDPSRAALLRAASISHPTRMQATAHATGTRGCEATKLT